MIDVVPRRSRPAPWSALAALIIGACVTTSSVPAVTSLDGRSCAPQLDLATAQSLALDAEKPLVVDIGDATACVQTIGVGRSIYVVFKLPESAEPIVVDVKSVALGSTLFSPRLLLLDEAGAVLRERSNDVFMFQDSSLYVGTRVHPGERYVVVASDPRAVGRRESRLYGATQATMMATGAGGFFWIHTGSEASRLFTYAHNGQIAVAVRLLPKLN